MIELLFPTHFTIKYPTRNFKYYSTPNKKKEIRKLLLEASSNYCMYCGNLIIINNKNYSHIEHSIEKKNEKKDNNAKYLTHCKYNLSIACSVCNTSFKKVAIKEVKINESYICPKTCNNICSEYQNNIDDYIRKNKIILMPQGIKNLNAYYYKIVYDVLNMTFKYQKNINYSKIDIDFIENHIKRFKLNDNEYKPSDVIKVCEYVIENQKIPKKKSFYNIIADLFIEYLNTEKITTSNITKLYDAIIIQNSL